MDQNKRSGLQFIKGKVDACWVWMCGSLQPLVPQTASSRQDVTSASIWGLHMKKLMEDFNKWPLFLVCVCAQLNHCETNSSLWLHLSLCLYLGCCELRFWSKCLEKLPPCKCKEGKTPKVCNFHLETTFVAYFVSKLSWIRPQRKSELQQVA